MASPTGRSEPDGLPASRRIIHVGTLVATAICFWIGCTIAGYTDPASTQSVPQAGWIGDWGKTLGDSTVNALLSYTAVTLVLFGISIGGQAAFEDPRHRQRIRRGVGLIGILIAVSALALAVFTIGAAVVNGSQWALLVVVFPMALICWVLGLEVGRFAVPAHGVQLDAARITLTTVTDRITNIRAASASGWTANLVVLGYGTVLGLVTGAVVQVLAGRGFWPASLVAAIGACSGLMLLLQICANTVAGPSRWRQVGTWAMTYAIYFIIVTYANIALIKIAPQASIGIVAVFVLELLLPVLFGIRTPERQALVNLTLRGALARVALQDLERQRDSTQRRIDLLEKQIPGSRTLTQQLTTTLRVLWTGVSGSVKP
ncbi:hypothetical protein [Curtobacterium sp. ME12]|uniref:hypothetical protein n=1 Tax=Curtobacterium sp. ME12 TaxID=2744253 RepID=UPI0015F593D4|nr:hypothetical protein [Curtobacterium sp. ME12]